MAYDAEIPAVIYGIFHELAFGPFTIYLNNRKLLRGLLEAQGVAEDRHEAVLHEIDRLGKRPRGEIEARLTGEGFGLDPGRVTSDRIAFKAVVRSWPARSASRWDTCSVYKRDARDECP